MEKAQPVIFFDGVCGLCNWFVDFLMSVDKGKKFLFSPLQSEFAAQNLPAELLSLDENQAFKSVVLMADGKIFQSSEAVLKTFEILGGVWRLLLVFRFLPKALRDLLYGFVAANRYNWFGKKESCRLPTAAERKRFRL